MIAGDTNILVYAHRRHGEILDALWSSDRDFSWFPDLRVVNPLLSHQG